MVARWQQWMPFHIDKFRGSPAVCAMSPEARIAYLYLLAAQWQTEDCTLPADDCRLQELSGLDETVWAAHRTRVLRQFATVCDGKLMNHVLRSEWETAQATFKKNHVDPSEVSKKRSEAGRKGNEIRWSSQTDRNCDSDDRKRIANGSQTDRKRSHTGTGTGTDTDTTTKTKTKPSRAKRASGEVKHSGDLRHVACKAEIFAYYQAKNQTDPEWNGREGKALGMLLGANPKLTAEGIKRLLGFRGQSDVNHAERPGKWIEDLGSYRAGPLDKFGKPKGATNGNGYYRSKTDGNAEAARQAIAELDGESSDLFGAGETGRVIEGDVEGLRPGTGGIR